MANQYTTGQKIEFLGSALSGQVPQFEQKMEQLDEKRMEAMYKDAGAAYDLFNKGNIGGIIDLANDRLNILQRLPGSDPSDTMQVMQLAQAAQAGDPQAGSQLGQVLQAADARGRSLGFDTSPISSAPATFQSRHMMALAAGFEEGTPEYQDYMARGSVDEFTPGLTRYRNGVAVSYSRGGKVQVLDENQQVVTGAEARAAIDRGLESGIAEQGLIAQAKEEGASTAGFATASIQEGIDAAKGLPYLSRALTLLDDLETGGFANLSLGVKRFFGLENADEAELDNILSQNVLSQLKQVFGAQFTEREGALLAEIEANYGKSTEGNKRLLSRLMTRARLYSDVAIDSAMARGDYATADSIRKYMSMDLTGDNDAGATPPQNADGVYIINTDEEFENIPIGSSYIDPDDGLTYIKNR
jgi:hypothetical protein